MPSGDIFFSLVGLRDDLTFVTGVRCGAGDRAAATMPHPLPADWCGTAGIDDGWPPAPLTDQQIARLERGDREGLAIGLGDDDGIVRLSGLLPGRYAFILDPDHAQPGTPFRDMAILTVLP